MTSEKLIALELLANAGKQGQKSDAIRELIEEVRRLQRRREKPKFALSDVMKAAEDMKWAPGLAEECGDFYRQGGWRYGKGNTKPIVDLPAAMRTWMRNHHRFNGNGRSPVGGRKTNHGVA